MMTRSPHIYTLSLHDALPISYTGGSTGRLHHYGSSLNSIPLLSEYREPSGRCVFAARGLRRDDGTAGKNKRTSKTKTFRQMRTHSPMSSKPVRQPLGMKR